MLVLASQPAESLCCVLDKILYPLLSTDSINFICANCKMNFDPAMPLYLALLIMEAPSDTFTNRADTDQEALISPGSTLFANGTMSRYDPTLVGLTSNFFVLCTNMKVYLMNYL